MSRLLLDRDVPIWLAAKPWLNVRSNDTHTLISYRLARALLRIHADAEEHVVLTAILLHDIGWKMFPEEMLVQAVGPKPRYPELQRAHEIESARLARIELKRLAIPAIDIEQVIAIIDGHDTRVEARSLNDALMKDADKLWRFTAHGVATLSSWFQTPKKETISMLESFVLPKFITGTGKTMAEGLLASAVAEAYIDAL